MGTRRGSSPVKVLKQWIKRQSMKMKIIMGAITALISLILLKVLVKNQSHFFVASETTHAVGILVLIFKLTTKKSCSGLSLKTQELTAIFLIVRMICSIAIEGDIHTVLDSITLASTLWVIYMIRFKLKSTYIKELDNMPLYYVLVPCCIIATLVHPGAFYNLMVRLLWSFCICVEAVSVLPQLRLMQNAKMVEPFTGHYVFALGVSRFLGCAHWIIQIYDTKGAYLVMVGKGHFWILLILIQEIVQTFILADFCYYYVKSLMHGQLIVRLPSPV